MGVTGTAATGTVATSLKRQRIAVKHLALNELVRRRVTRDGDFAFFAEHVLGYTVNEFHKSLIDFQNAAGDRCLQLAPRGFGKSTLLTVARAVFEIIRDPNIRILIASKTEGFAETILREIKHHFELNERLRELFGDFVGDKWHEREIVVKPRTALHRESTVTCVGVGGATAGLHCGLLLGDDLVDDRNSRTAVQREKIKTWFYKEFMPCVLDTKSRAFFAGTRYHPLDLYGHLIKNEYAKCYQIIRAIADDGSTPWPEKFSIEWLENLRHEIGTAIFNSQYQNDTALMKGNIFRDEWFQFYGQQKDWENYHHFIGCDPAATKKDVLLSADKADSDWWTIVIGAVHTSNPDGVFVRRVWRARCTKAEYLETLRNFNTQYKPLCVSIETVAAQEYLAQDAEKYMPVHRVERTTDKIARAYWLQPFVEFGEIKFPDKSIWLDHEPWQELLDELLLFPQGEHDDLFDGLQTMMLGAKKFEGYKTHGLAASSQSGISAGGFDVDGGESEGGFDGDF